MVNGALFIKELPLYDCGVIRITDLESVRNYIDSMELNHEKFFSNKILTSHTNVLREKIDWCMKHYELFENAPIGWYNLCVGLLNIEIRKWNDIVS